MIIDEFSAYTLREVDMRFEADNAETFSGDLKMSRSGAFHAFIENTARGDILRTDISTGIKPDETALRKLTAEQRRQAIDLGIGAVVRMIYRDGFFHADLHPANLMIFEEARLQGGQRRIYRPGDGRQVHTRDA